MKAVQLLQLFEAMSCVAVGSVGTYLSGISSKTPVLPFAMTGLTQVLAKAFTNMSLMYGLSFPVATLAKSAKAAPVMAGSLILGGAKYKLREYLQVRIGEETLSSVPIVAFSLFE